MAAPGRQLNPFIMELTGGVVDAQIRSLSSFESHAAGSVTAGYRTWVGHMFLVAGANPAAMTDSTLETGDTDSATFVTEGPAAAIGTRFRAFCARQFALVERALHGRLLAFWNSLGPDVQRALRFHAIMTMRRDTALHGPQPIHADTMDGTMLAFAVMSNKLPTPVYPAATWPDALTRFIAEARGTSPGRVTRPTAIHVPVGREGRRRPSQAAAIVVLPPAVAHSIPAGESVHETSTVDSTGAVLARDRDNRWFCRMSLEIVPARGNATDGSAWTQYIGWDSPVMRARVACAAAEHVWGDADFAAAARAALASS